MKYCKTIQRMIDAEKEGGTTTIYGYESYQKILNLKEVESADRENGRLKLKNGEIICFIYKDYTA